MTFDVEFMAWIDALPEVGDPIRKERAKLLQLAEQAAELERHALALRAQVLSGQAALADRVARHWPASDIEAAHQKALNARRAARPAAGGVGGHLRDALDALDGAHLAAEALQAFDSGRLLRQANLVSTATHEARHAALAEVMAWWNEAAVPVLERLEEGRGLNSALRARA